MEGKDKTGFRLTWNGLTKRDTNVLKAICILVIVLHNFLHVFPNWAIENEFAFDRAKFEAYRNGFTNDLFHNFGLFFSYFGHYGVQLFVFLSGYGLYLSTRGKEIRYWGFVRDRVSKLYPTFLIAALMVAAIHIASQKNLWQPELYYNLFLRLTFLSNLVPGKSFALVGPWWFYSMIVQFYLIFPWLKKLFDRYGATPLILLSLASCLLQVFFNDPLDRQGILINTTVIGHLPIFALGFLAARYKSLPMPAWVFLLCCALFYAGNLDGAAWVFSRIWITVIILYVYVALKRVIRAREGWWARALLFTGEISMYIFAVNGFLRHPFMHQALKTDNPALRFAITAAFVLFVYGVALLLRAAERLYFRILSRDEKGSFVFLKKKIRLEGPK